MARHVETRYKTLRQLRAQGITPQQLAALTEAQKQVAAALARLPEEE